MYVVSWEVDDDWLMTTEGCGVVDNGAGRSGDVHKPHRDKSIGVQGIKLSDGLLGGVSGIFECPLAVVLNLSNQQLDFEANFGRTGMEYAGMNMGGEVRDALPGALKEECAVGMKNRDRQCGDVFTCESKLFQAATHDGSCELLHDGSSVG